MALSILRCSFCGKPQREARKLFASPNVYVCDECFKLLIFVHYPEQADGEEAPSSTPGGEGKGVPVPCAIEGVNDEGRRFEIVTTLEEVSSDHLLLQAEAGDNAGLYLRIRQRVEKASRASVLLRFGDAADEVMFMMFGGRVVGVAPRPGGEFSVACKVGRCELCFSSVGAMRHLASALCAVQHLPSVDAFISEMPLSAFFFPIPQP